MIWSWVWLIVSICAEAERNCTTHLSKLFVETFDETGKNLSCVRDLFSVLANNPDQASSRIRIVQVINTLAECGDDALVAGVTPEDVLDHHDHLLHHIANLCVDELEEHIDCLLSTLLNFDRHLTNRTDRLLHKVHVNLHRIFLELVKQLVCVAVVCYSDHDLQFCEFEIRRVVVLAEEYSQLLVQDSRLLLQEEVDVLEGNVLHFGL